MLQAAAVNPGPARPSSARPGPAGLRCWAGAPSRGKLTLQAGRVESSKRASWFPEPQVLYLLRRLRQTVGLLRRVWS